VSPTPRLVAATLALAAALVASGFWRVTYDDGYITYRYADRLAAGRGLTYNDGERVLGTSAPGYAVALAALARIAAPFGGDVRDAGSLLFFAGLVALAAGLSGVGPGGVAFPCLYGFLALTARFDLELAGCETVPALLAAVAALELGLGRDRPVAAGLAAAAATALRADHGLLLAVLGLALWGRARAFPARFALAAGAPLAAGAAALYGYFGTVVPATLAAKRAEMALAAPGYGRAQWEWLERGYGVAGAWVLVGLAVAGLALGWRRLAARRAALAAGGAWLVAHEVFYRAVAVPFSPWYHVATFHALLALAALGAWEIAARATEAASARGTALAGAGRRLPAAAAALAGLVVLPLALPSLGFVATHWGEPPDPRVRLYRDVALAADACPAAGEIAAVEIGALGYFSRRDVVDLVGLVDPELRRARGEGRLPAAAAARRPALVVDHPVFREPYLGQLLAMPEIAGTLAPMGTFTRPEYPTAVRLWAPAGRCAPARPPATP
jgi:hypothetical protein